MTDSIELCNGEQVLPPADCRAANILWNFHNITEDDNVDLLSTDLAIVSGHVDGLVDYAASLYKQGVAPRLLFGGGLMYGQVRGLDIVGDSPEAFVYFDRAVKLGVDPSDIIIEGLHKNMGEAVQTAQWIIKSLDADIKKVIWICEPDKKLRSWATIKKQFGIDVDVVVNSFTDSLSDYARNTNQTVNIIRSMVKNTLKLGYNYRSGFQVEVPVPDEVYEAAGYLVDKGYLG
jgi:hypothetical protein